jgi:hypothetical protein
MRDDHYFHNATLLQFSERPIPCQAYIQEERNRLLLIHTTNNAHPSSGAATARRWLPAVAQTEFMRQASPALKLGGKMKRLFHHLRENTS